MKHIYFIRSYTGYFKCDYYEQKTDVCVFGDIEGYKYLINNLNKAKRSENNIRLLKLNFNSNTMNVVILKSEYNKIKQPRIKFVERIIYVNDKPEMELIIFGTDKGYDFLIDIFKGFINDVRENLEAHSHLDENYFTEVVKRSIALNIRDALKKWDKRKLNLYREDIYNIEKKYLPYDLDDYKLVEPYSDIDPKGNIHLSLKRK